MKRVFAFIFLSILCNTTGKAQQIFMRKIQHPNGIQAHDIYSVFEDSKHYLWFTTDGGIWRFDGKNYKNFTTENGLPDNVVFLFCEDDKNRAWFNTYSNKLAFIEKDSVHIIPCNDTLSQLKKMEIPACIYLDKKNIIYISYFRSDDYIKIVPPYKKENIRLIRPTEKDEFFSIEIEKGGLITGSTSLFLQKEARSMVFLKNNQSIAKMTDSSGFFNGHRVSCYKQYDHSFLVSADNVVGEYKDGIIKKKISLNYSVLSALKDRHHNYWVSTIDGGLFFYKNSDSTFLHPEIYLKGKSVGRVMQDHEGAYWITTLNDGIYYIPHRDVMLGNSTTGLSDNIAYVFCDTFKKNIFCIDAKGSLFIRQHGEIIKTLNCNTRQDMVNQIKSIVPISKSRYLFFGRNSFLLNAINWKINYIPTLQGINASSSCHKDNIWVSKQAYLFKLNSRTGDIEIQTGFKAKINSIYVANDSILWLGTERGLIKYNFVKNKLLSTPVTIENKSIISIVNLSPGKNLIIYKSDGILIVDDALNAINRLLVDIKGYSIKHVTKDAHNNIWISTNKGVLRIDSKLKIKNINERDGLPGNIVNAISTDDKKVYVACDKGLIEFPITKEFLNQTPPDIYLNSVLINNTLRSSDTIFSLKHDQNFIKISFTAINYRLSNDIVCLYKMEGIDDNWKITKNSEIEYTTLPPGDYHLIIYAINNDRIPSSKRLNLYFTISSPFWKTWWFITTISVSMIILMSVIFRWRISLIRKRSKEKSDLQEQLGQMEMQALRSQMNPHFIFNAINSIQHYILSNEPFLANKYLVKFSKLVRNVLEQSMHELISLEEEIETLRFYIEIESLRFDDSFSYEINVSSGTTQEKIKIPSLILQPYVENAIWHGLLLKKGEKKLLINVYTKSQNLIIEIDDNGIGRKTAAAFKKNEIKKKSLGMEITQNRLDILSKSLDISLEVKIIDKISEDGESAGTTVIIRTPLLF
jgi:sensor histidine kinase YesM/ligand-binding sensor domain-containing protein